MHKTISGVTVKDATKGEVSAVFSTFNVVDKDGDLTLPGAIKDGTEVVISAYGHESHFGKLPVGKGVIRTTDEEAILEGKFFLNTVAGRDTFEVVKELGDLQEWSYHLGNTTRKSVDVDGRHYWVIEDIGLIKEVSPVLMGAGVNTRTLAAKALSDAGLTPESVAAWAKGHLSLQDQIAGATDVVRQVIDSAERVVALRAEKGKSLSNVNAESLARLCAEVDRLKALLDPEVAESAGGTDDIPEDIRAIAVQVMSADLFSNLNQNGA